MMTAAVDAASVPNSPRLLAVTVLTSMDANELAGIGINGPDQQLPVGIHVQHGVNRLGKRLHYFFNYSAATAKATYSYASGNSLLDGKSVSKGAELTLAPWDLAIIEE